MSNLKGQIWTYKDEDSGKIRPCVIVGHATIAEIEVTVAKVFGTERERNEYDYFLEDWKEIGLIKESTVRCSKLMTLKKGDLKFKVGELPPQDFRIVQEKIISYIID